MSLDGALRVLVLVVLLLVVARGLGTLTARLGLTRVVGELGTGFVLGPSVFGAVAPSTYEVIAPAVATPALTDLSLLGLVLLLTLAGLEVDTGLLRSFARDIVVIGSAGLVAPFALGIALGLALPASLLTSGTPRLVVALFLGTSLCISAIPVIVRILIDLDAFDGPFGQRTVAMAMYTDVIGWLLLSVVVGLARVGRIDGYTVAIVVFTLIGVVLVALTVGQRVVTAVLARLPADDVYQHLAVLTVAAVLGSAGTYAVGIEPALGAFLVGLLFARAGGVPDPARQAFERVTLGAFAPVFFGVAGLNADLGALLDGTVAVVAAVTVLVATVGKVGGVYVAATALGYDRTAAASTGVALNARGAIEIVIATVGLELGVLSPQLYTVVLVVAVVTSAMTPPLLRRLIGPATGGDPAPPDPVE